jgi:hypothetical protein
MATPFLPDFDEMVDLLRVRLGMADDLDDSKIHSFRDLMSHEADAGLIPDHFYWRAFEELEAEGHLDPASHKEFGGNACGRLSAEGRWYLRSAGDSSSETAI